MENPDSVLDIIGDKLADLMTSDLVIGSPIELGEVTIVPLSRVSLGFGGGGGGGEDGATTTANEISNSGSGGGGGAGAQLKPVAVAVFNGEGVDVLKVLDMPSPIEKLLHKLPDLIDRFKK